MQVDYLLQTPPGVSILCYFGNFNVASPGDSLHVLVTEAGEIFAEKIADVLPDSGGISPGTFNKPIREYGDNASPVTPE